MAVCGKCGEPNPDRARFCLSCGSRLGATPHEPQSRKLITMVFSDVTDSTGLGERLDPETFRRILSEYFGAMKQVLEKHGGRVEKYVGDRVLGVFGVPQVREDDALRAVRAADEMRARLESLNDELYDRWGVRLKSRSAVNTGEVVVGGTGEAEGLVLGDSANVAARLEATADPGEILLGELAYNLVHESVMAEPVGRLELRGKEAPVEAYRLIKVLDRADQSRRIRSQIVGREREMRLLKEAFKRSSDDRVCHLFSVLGPAGVGKSRLIDEFVDSVRSRAKVVQGRCLSYGEGITYWPVVELIQDALGLGVDSPTEEVRRRATAILDGHGEVELIVDRLMQLLGARETLGKAEEDFWGLRKFVEALAQSSPVLIVFDDIHWAEPTFLDLVDHIVDWSRDAPIFVICVARPELFEIRPNWGGGKFNSTSILLDALSPEEAQELVANLLEDRELASRAHSLVEASEGYPLYVEEMISMLIDDGLLQTGVDGWEAMTDIDKVAVPPTIQTLVAARLDRLSLEERQIIECASVVGKVFTAAAVSELLPPAVRPRLQDHLVSMIRRELLQPQASTIPGELTFSFKHILIQETACRRIPKEVRAELHEKHARWMEEIAGDRKREFEEVIGYHLEQAHRLWVELGVVDLRATEVGRLAGARLASAALRAQGRGDMSAAAKLLTRAATVMVPDDPERLRLLPDLSTALRETGQFQRAEKLLGEAAALAEKTGDEWLDAHVGLELAALHQQTDPMTGIEEGLSESQRAIRVFDRIGDDSGRAKAWQLIAGAFWGRCLFREVDESLDKALVYAEEAGDRLQQANIRTLLAMSASLGPLSASEGIEKCQRLLADSEGDLWVESAAYRSLARFRAMEGRFDEAKRLLGQGFAILEELGLKLLIAVNTQVSYFVHMLADEPEEAEEAIRRGFNSLTRMGDKFYSSTSAAMVAQTLVALGRHAEAEEFSQISKQLAPDHDVITQIMWRGAQAKILANRGETGEALRLAQEGVDIAEQTDVLNVQGDALMDFAHVLHAADRQDSAAEVAQRAADAYARKGNEVCAAKARAATKASV